MFQLFNTFTTRQNNTICRMDQILALNPILADLDSNDAENQKIFCSPSQKNISERVKIKVSPEQVGSYLKSIQIAEVCMSSHIFDRNQKHLQTLTVQNLTEHFYLFTSTAHQGATAGTLGLTVPLKKR